MNAYVLVAVGSAFGGIARHWCGLFVAARTSDSLPWGTISVNVVGSFLIGLIAAALEVSERSSAQLVRELVIVGFLGGFTTFSAFSLQTLNLLRDGKLAYAAANIALSIALCLVAVAMGHFAARGLRP